MKLDVEGITKNLATNAKERGKINEKTQSNQKKN